MIVVGGQTFETRDAVHLDDIVGIVFLSKHLAPNGLQVREVQLKLSSGKSIFFINCVKLLPRSSANASGAPPIQSHPRQRFYDEL
jgi:hypothetical protein